MSKYPDQSVGDDAANEFYLQKKATHDRRREILARIVHWLAGVPGQTGWTLRPVNGNLHETDLDGHGHLVSAEGMTLFVQFARKGSIERGYVCVEWPRDAGGVMHYPPGRQRPRCTFNPERDPKALAAFIRKTVIEPGAPICADLMSRIADHDNVRTKQLEIARIMQTALGASAQYRQGNDLCIDKSPINVIVRPGGLVTVSVTSLTAEQAQRLLTTIRIETAE